MRRALVVTALAVALSAPIASASANSTITVPGLAFPSDDTYLTYFGCQDLYHADTESPQVRIDRGSAPSGGTRSFGVLMPGSGTASGPVHAVSSVADTTVASFSARARSGAGTGVAYVWYVTPGLQPGQVWAGRADLTLGGAWQTVDTTASSYTWKLVTAATGEEVRDGGTSTIADFTDENGDGPGYLLAGFGCNHEEFSIDRLRYGSPGNVTTYDLEGIAATAEMKDPSEAEVAAGDPVTITGHAVANGAPIGASLVLEAKPAGADDDAFKAVGDAIPESDDGWVRKVVHPEESTVYRWYLPAMGYADATWSTQFIVTVKGDEPEPGEEPTESPSTEPSDSPSSDSVEVPALPTPAPSDEPSDEPSAEPTDEPTTEPSDEPTEQPTETPSDEPSDAPSDAPDSATP